MHFRKVKSLNGKMRGGSGVVQSIVDDVHATLSGLRQQLLHSRILFDVISDLLDNHIFLILNVPFSFDREHFSTERDSNPRHSSKTGQLADREVRL